ncbi:unnamed protein product [Psylliodes chrysocephalus]|uniref:Uncharacterized protein n=1 Tax=Psylliodes chrysocephalus TaxID=3402493 RepID=A0A9P0G6N2_9CUCU|nr:unnamed protein product [Psylliodes chrysocephala]
MLSKMFAIGISLVLCFALVILESVDAQCIGDRYNTMLSCWNIKKISRESLNKTFENCTSLHIINTTEPLGISAFRNMKNLIHLKISGDRIGLIFSETFKDMPHLKDVHIEFIKIGDIQESAFFNLPELEFVTIINMDIPFLRRGLFRNDPQLFSISFYNSNIHYIQNDPFYDVPKLKELFLDNNLLTVVTKDMLNKLTNLEILILSNNNISIIENNSFYQTPHLSYLDLMNNQLKELDWNMFPTTGMKYLQEIYLNGNQLMYLPSTFFNKTPKLEKFGINGNPWLCPCLRDIERILNENNIRELWSRPKSTDVSVQQPSPRIPICINRNVSNDICTNTYSEELSKKYWKYLEDYEDFFYKLPSEF